MMTLSGVATFLHFFGVRRDQATVNATQAAPKMTAQMIIAPDSSAKLRGKDAEDCDAEKIVMLLDIDVDGVIEPVRFCEAV